MSVNIEDLKEVSNEIKIRVEEFKKANDRNIETIKSNMETVKIEKKQLDTEVKNLNEKLSKLEDVKKAMEKDLQEIKRREITAGGGKNDLKPEIKNFIEFVKSGKIIDKSQQIDIQKDLNTMEPEKGGVTVPAELDKNIINIQRDMVVMRQACNMVSVSTSDYKFIAYDGTPDSGWVAEKDPRPTTDAPKTQAIDISLGELYANPCATQTMLDDAFFDVNEWIQNDIAEEFSQIEEKAFTTGSGVNQPKGLLQYDKDVQDDPARAFGVLQKVMSGEAANITADSLLSLVYKLRSGYRSGAGWMMSRDSLYHVRTLKDDNNNYLWTPSLEAGQPSTLLGFPVFENEQMPDMVAGSLPIAFGNFKRGYTIVDRIGLRMIRDMFTNKPFISFYTTKRVGGALTDANAIKLLEVGV